MIDIVRCDINTPQLRGASVLLYLYKNYNVVQEVYKYRIALDQRTKAQSDSHFQYTWSK